MLECGLQKVEMARAITELQYEATLSGYRQSHVSSALKIHNKYLISQPSHTTEMGDMIMGVCEMAKRDSGL